MNAPTRISAGHPYSPTCNCDACFEAWMAMPEPTPAERKAMAREFSKMLWPAGGGELLTDYPVTFPDLDRLSDAELERHAKQQRRFNRNEGRG